MASLPAEEKLEFLLSLLCDAEFTPNYQATMVKCGINTAGNTQRRLKGIVEADKRFRLDAKGGSTKIIDLRSSEEAKQAAPVTEPARGKKRGKKDDSGDTGNVDSKKIKTDVTDEDEQ